MHKLGYVSLTLLDNEGASCGSTLS